MKRNPPYVVAIGLVLLALTASSAGAQASQPPKVRTATAVLLIANMAEAEASCGCGEIIRMVRAAADHGVRTREVDARNKDEGAKVRREYRVTADPTVLLLDDAGREMKRFEGESKNTILALMHELNIMVKRK